jgi:septin family protein
MEGSKIDYDLNIIDTPGFGDTRGIIRDKAIVDQIREFFTTPGV